MSLSHYIAFKIVNKGKTVYDKNAPPDYAERRRKERDIPAPKGVKVSDIYLDGISCEFLTKEGNAKDKVLLYIHGGGFVGGSSASRRDFTGYVAGKLGYNVCSANYRLAPENPFPCGAKDCFEVYRALTQKYGAKNICLIGESAGGNLVLSAALQAKAWGAELPACIVLFSPTVQYTLVYPSCKRNLSSDCMLSASFLDEVKAAYLKTKENQTNPYAAPLLGDFTGFPLVYIGVSDSEYLFDDSVELYKKLQASGVESKLDVFHKKMHAFQVIPAFPEAKKALNDAKKFMDKYLISGGVK